MVSFWRSPDSAFIPCRDDEESGGEGFINNSPTLRFSAEFALSKANVLQKDSPGEKEK